jgi:hypothetical protein
MRRLEARQDALSVAKEQLAGLGQRDRARPAGAFDQADVHDPLERCDLLADRGLRVSELGRRAPEGSLVGNRLERCQVAKLDAQPSIMSSNGVQRIPDLSLSTR